MASPSSFTSCNYSYNVFTSFHGPDVRKTLLSHMRKQFNHNGITMFDDEEIKRSATIAPSLKNAIKKSRISIVILSKKYASSRWCLDELVEILECKKAMGMIVMTIFYEVEPSDVRKQSGDFGITFNQTCASKTCEEKQKWREALNDVGNIAGEDFSLWKNEANMIEKIARDVSNKLNIIPQSMDFNGMVGLEAHLREMKSLLHLENDEAMIVGISGPAGIGKTTIARALYNELFRDCDFSLRYFMENVRGRHRSIDCDEYGLKLLLQEQLLSNILNQSEMQISHLDVMYERLQNQKVLIILDDVDHLEQLDALARDISWFGRGSRIIVTTEDQELLQQHDIDNKYHVDFPSDEEALEIFCLSAFNQISPPDDFGVLAKRAIELCSNLPLGLHVVGSSLRKKKKNEWEVVLQRLETGFDGNIERILRVGYDNLHEKTQALFLYIAIFLNYRHNEDFKVMLAGVDEGDELKTLVDKSLLYISTKGQVVMHKLLQQVGIQAIRRQEPWKRHILIDAHEIFDVLQYDTGTSMVSGISLDISRISEVTIGERAFHRMPNLRFLKVYKNKENGNYKMNIPEKMDFPHCLRLLEWEAYPNKCIPSTFHMEYLVELGMRESELEYLWQGIQPLTNLKRLMLSASSNLKELPDLSHATNLELLELGFCSSLIEIPSSCSHLHKLKMLWMVYCTNLEVIPSDMNLASLEHVYLFRCSKLRNIPLLSTNIKVLSIAETAVEDVPASTRLCTRLKSLYMSHNGKLNGLAYLPTSLTDLDLSNSDIERIPDSFKTLYLLEKLHISGCRRLRALPELPSSLTLLNADDCESLENVVCPMNHAPDAEFVFTNCFKLSQHARTVIIRGSVFCGSALLPGKRIPTEFNHQAKGNTLTICLDCNMPFSPYLIFGVCVMIFPNEQTNTDTPRDLLCRRIGTCHLDPIDDVIPLNDFHKCQTEHLYVFPSDFPEASGQIEFQFSSLYHNFDVVGCGIRLWTGDLLNDKKIHCYRSKRFNMSRLGGGRASKFHTMFKRHKSLIESSRPTKRLKRLP